MKIKIRQKFIYSVNNLSTNKKIPEDYKELAFEEVKALTYKSREVDRGSVMENFMSQLILMMQKMKMIQWLWKI